MPSAMCTASGLVAHRHQPDAVRLQLRQQRIDLRGGQAEQELDSFCVKRSGEQLAASNLRRFQPPIEVCFFTGQLVPLCIATNPWRSL